MDKYEGQQRFREADRLFLAGEYQGALRELEALNGAYPHTKNILYPMALCLERLGRGPEAVPLCQQLIAEFRDRRAEDLWQRLLADPDVPSGEAEDFFTDDFSGAYELPDLGEVYRPPLPEQSDDDEPRWPNYVLGGAAVLILTGLMIARVLLGDGRDDVVGPSASPDKVAALGALLLTYFALSQVVGTAAGIFALGTLSRLPDNTISGNIFNVGGTILVVNLASMIIAVLFGVIQSWSLYFTACALQHIVLVFVFNHYYRLGCGGMFVFGFMYFIFSVTGIFLPYMILLSALGIATFFLW